MGKAIAKYKGAIVISLPRTASRPGVKVNQLQAHIMPQQHSSQVLLSVLEYVVPVHRFDMA